MIAWLASSLRSRLIAGCSAIAAVVMAVLLLWAFYPAPRPLRSDIGPVEPRALPSGLDMDRRLFQDPIDAETAAPPPDTPALAGIVGRLPDNAVAMVRDDDGRTRIVAIGQQHRGWRLESLSGEAAFFSRGNQRVRVALPASVDEAVDEDDSTLAQ